LSCPQAIRGAAPSFGIIISFTVKTQSAPASNVFFNYVFSPLNVTAAVETFLAYQNFGANKAPPTLGMYVVLGNGNFEMSGVFYGPISNFTAVIQPLLDAVPQQPKSKSVKTYDWLGVLQQLAGSDGSLNTSTKADISDTFDAKSLMVDEDAPLTKTALQSFFNYLYGPEQQQIHLGSSRFVLSLIYYIHSDCFRRLICGVALARPSMQFQAMKLHSPIALLFTRSNFMRRVPTRPRPTHPTAYPLSMVW
jgi:hypothetical protein